MADEVIQLSPEEIHSIRLEDNCHPARNYKGHLIECSYGDQYNFQHCTCTEGLASAPDADHQVQVGPMPMRDMIAMHIDIPWVMAQEVAKMKAHSENRIRNADGNIPVGLNEVCEARALLRYIEADAMLAARNKSTASPVPDNGADNEQ